MTSEKHEYVERLREASLYPGFRALIDMITTFLVLVAGLVAVVTLFTAIPQFGGGGFLLLIFGFVQALAIYYAARLFRWVAMMFADLVDSTLARNAHEQRAE